MTYRATTNINFKENCEYEKSSKATYVDMEAKEIGCIISIEYKEKYYVGDECYVTVIAKHDEEPVKNGFIKLKYQCGNDEQEDINRGQFFYLDENGMAKIKIKLKGNNKKNERTYIYCEYIDKSGFFYCNSENIAPISIEVLPLKTELTLSSDTNFVVSSKEEVTLTAKVTHNNIPVPYGKVYFEHFVKKAQELDQTSILKPISTPISVNENGEATIRYIPLKSLDEGVFKVDRVRATYNKEGNKYYYGESVDEKDIHILNYDDIDIQVYKKNNNNYELINPQDSYKWSCSGENDNLVAVGNIVHNGNKMIFDTNKKITFNIEGTIIQAKTNYTETPKSVQEYVENAFNFIPYPKISKEAYYKNENGIKGFILPLTDDNDIGKLSPGFYTITASSERQEQLNGDVIDYFEAKSSSMIYYLQQLFYNVNYSLSFNINDNTEFNPNTNLKNEIEVSINGLTDKEKEILKNQETTIAYFSIPSLSSKQYKGKITLTHNTFLSIIPDEDIFINEVGYHDIVVYIKSGIYSYRNDSFNLQQINESVMVKILATLDASFKAETINNFYPGVVQHTTQINNLLDEQLTCQVSNSVNNQVDNFLINSSHPKQTNTIENIPAGTHTATCTIENKLQQTKEFIIEKATISQEQTTILPNLKSVPNAVLSVFLNTNGVKFGDIDTSKFEAYIVDIDDDFVFEESNKAVIQSIRKIDNQLLVQLETGVYKQGTYKVHIKYNNDNDNNYNKTIDSGKYDIFYANDIDTSITTKKENNILTLEMQNPTLQNIIFTFLLTNDNQDTIRCMCITDKDGKVSCNFDENRYNLNDYDLMKINIDATSLEMISTVKKPINEFKQTYDRDYVIFYGKESDGEETIYNELKNQLENYKNECLFAGIKTTSKQQRV